MNWIDAGQNKTTFLGLLSPGPNERILDVGAGKGTIASLVHSIAKSEVHALDSNKKRIASIQENHPDVKSCLASSDSIPYPERFFDKAYSTMAVHHFQDQQKSFGEIARVLKPGGLLVIVEISPNTFLGKLARFFENGILRSRLTFLDAGELSAKLEQRGDFNTTTTTRDSSVYFLRAVRTSEAISQDANTGGARQS